MKTLIKQLETNCRVKTNRINYEFNHMFLSIATFYHMIINECIQLEFTLKQFKIKLYTIYCILDFY